MLALLLNTIMQELLARSYIYQLSKKQFGTKIATIITTILFTIMHGGAFEVGPIAIVNIITMSLLMTIILEYSNNSLLIPIIMHLIWNVMGGLIFGVVSLADDYPELYNLRVTGNPIISGGSVGMEGSVFVLIVNTIMIAIFYSLYMKRNDQ